MVLTLGQIFRLAIIALVAVAILMTVLLATAGGHAG